jgi:hypothetical protein
VVSYDPKLHTSVSPGMRQGQPVRIVRPGYDWTHGGKTVRGEKATVQAAPVVSADAETKDIVARLQSGEIDSAEAARLFSEHARQRQAAEDAAAGRGQPGGVFNPTEHAAKFDLTGLTTRQKRARLKALGFTPEQIDELAPTLAMQKKGRRSDGSDDDEFRDDDELDDEEEDDESDDDEEEDDESDDDEEEDDESDDDEEDVEESDEDEDLEDDADEPVLDPAARDRAIQLLELRVLGQDVTPGREQLHHYWTRGKGLAKWRGSPHPWTALVGLLTEHVGPQKAKVFASKWFHEVFGYWSGHRKGRNPVGPG